MPKLFNQPQLTMNMETLETSEMQSQEKTKGSHFFSTPPSNIFNPTSLKKKWTPKDRSQR